MLAGSSEVESKKIPFATFLLIAICVIATFKAYSLQVGANPTQQQQFDAYLYGHSLGNSAQLEEQQEFYDTYGFKISHFKEGNFLSIFTHIFIHTDLIKLLANMLAFWVFAVALEELLGAVKFLGLFFSGGLLGAVAQGCCFPETASSLFGAGAGVAAVMAAYLAIFGCYSTVRLFNFRVMGISIKEMPAQVFCALWLFSQVKCMFAGATAIEAALVANAAGLAVGLVSGLMLRDSLNDRIVVSSNGGVQIDSGVKAEKTSEQKFDEVLEEQPFSIVAQAFAGLHVPCPACGSSLDMQNPVGERLVKCGGKCSQMTYVDGQVLANSLVGSGA